MQKEYKNTKDSEPGRAVSLICSTSIPHINPEDKSKMLRGVSGFVVHCERGIGLSVSCLFASHLEARAKEKQCL